MILLDAMLTGAACVGGLAYAANWPTSQIFGRTLVAARVPGAPAEHAHPIALTYDDGPSPRNTELLLEVLAEHGARATFFLIGAHVRKHPQLARSVLAAGHVVGNHTDMHPALARKAVERNREEITRCQRTIEDVLGVSPRLFRPPYGSRRPATLRIAREVGLTPVLWNITAHDWSPIGEQKILRKVEQGIARNRTRGVASNLLLHDASHLDGAEASQCASRADTIAVTRSLLLRTNLEFVTPETWIAPER